MRRAGTAGGGPGSGCVRQSSCIAIQQEQEALLADGVQRLTALREMERTVPSPFSIPEPVVSGCADVSRLQSAGHKSRRRR